jgi:hypothetical protein
LPCSLYAVVKDQFSSEEQRPFPELSFGQPSSPFSSGYFRLPIHIYP